MTRLPLALVALVFACRGSQPVHDDDATPSPTKSEVEQQLAGAAAGEERQMADGVFMTMYRTQASAPIGEGWHRAASTGGGFSVELPLAFNDFMTRAQTTDQVELRSHTVGGQTPGLLTWSATCIVRRDGKLGPDGRAGGLDEFEVMGTPPKAHTRSIEFDDMQCFLIVEAQGSDPLPPEADRTRFLQSFVRTSAPVW